MAEKDRFRFKSIRQTSELTGLTEQSLRCYCNRGLISYVKLGKYIMVDIESLYDYCMTFARKTIRERAEEQIKLCSHEN